MTERNLFGELMQGMDELKEMVGEDATPDVTDDDSELNPPTS